MKIKFGETKSEPERHRSNSFTISADSFRKVAVSIAYRYVVVLTLPDINN